MNTDFQLNSYKNFNSDFFQLVPSKFVTLGECHFNKINSGLSESQSNKRENIIFKQIPSNQSNKFKFDFDKNPTNFEKNNIIIKENISFSDRINKGKIIKNNDATYFNNSFKTGSKTILNEINTCLLDLFSPKKNIIKNNIENQDNNTQTGYKLINILNDEFLFETKKNNNIDKSNFLIEKIKCSPLKKMEINKDEKNNENINNKTGEKLVEIKNKNDLKKPLLDNKNNKVLVQGAFKAMNSNNEYPAKIQPQSSPFPKMALNQNLISNALPNITTISNITNITNNYYFQCESPKNLLKKKTKRIQSINKDNTNDFSTKKKNKDNSINIKFSKKDNLSYGLYQLNQISVNGVSISKFPVVSMNEDDLEVHLLSKMLNETDYFTIVDKYYINIPVLDEEKYNKPFYDKIFKKEKEKIANLYLIGDNINENNPIKLIRNFYSQIKNKILNIQKNYLSNNQKALSSNIELCNEIEKLIISCNAITNTVTDYKKSGLKRKLFLEHNEDDDKKNNINNNTNKQDISKDNNNTSDNKNSDENNSEENNNLDNKKKKPKKKHFKTYLCEFCNKAYSNGQGLGGHMSRIHPNKSYKYKDKIRIRREREQKRENLLIIKRDLFKKYGYNFDKLLKDKNRPFIQKFLSEHNEEYKNLRKSQKKDNKNENISENEENEKKFKNTNIFVTPIPTKMTNIYKRQVDCKEIISNNLSKEKTNDKSEIKNNILESGQDNNKNEIGFNAKLKINFIK